MANKNFNTQIRKKFDNGSEKPSKPGRKGMKAKDMLDRNPNRSMSPETRKRLRDAMERRRNLKRKEKTGRPKELKQPKQPIGKPPLKKSPLRKPSDKQQREMRRVKELEKRQFGKTSEDKKPRINKLKDKINKIGDMKVKDAAKAMGTAALATTPLGLAKNAAKSVNKNFKFQSPIVRKNRKFGGK
tara:strand:+ start:234 stop:791 length:558 start_codon:yes stop_codon:yes gene_type:complete